MTEMQMHDGRVDWVDYAKGFCIVFVVMMHSTLGLEQAAGQEGWLHHVVAFALPFRMPDFFMIAGLFLGRIVDRPWRGFLDRKVVHFAYFYLLWMTIQLLFKAPGMAAEHGAQWVVQLYFLSLIEPLGILWFIYLLPIFFVVVKLTRRVPPPIVWLIAAALEIAHVAHVYTDWTAPGEFCNRFVYFYTGYLMAGPIFALTAKAQAKPWLALGGLAVWALVNGTMVQLGYETLPFVSLGLGLVGAGAVVTSAALMAKSDLFKPLRYCGRNSIVIYLAFFLPMAATRTLLLKTGVISDIGTMSLIVTAAGIIGALALFWLVRGTKAAFLFERPAMFRLTERKFVLQPAE